MSDSATAAVVDVLDPDIRRFVSEMSASYARHPSFDTLTRDETRAVCEEVRRPWRLGGPVMAETRDLEIPSPEGKVRVRVFRPEGAAALAPALVYMHGGGWTIFSLDTHDRLMREYAARAGVIVVGVDYALSPEAKFPTALNQVAAVVRWLITGGAEAIGADPARLALGGDSAGGNLAVCTAVKLRDEGQGDAISALLLNYAVVDAEVSAHADRLWGGPGFMLTGEEMTGFWANYLSAPDEAKDPLACPMRADLTRLPPIRLAIAECDVLAEQNLAFAARLADAGVATEAVVYEGATHSFLEAASISGLARRALQDGADWLRARLKAA